MPSIGFEPIFYGNSSTFYKHNKGGYGLFLKQQNSRPHGSTFHLQ